MRTSLFRKLGIGAFAAATGVTACGTAPVEPASAPPPATAAAPPADAPTAAPVAEAPIPIPVTAKDPSWGSANAPVTIVELADFQCPFCDRARGTVLDLEEAYGPEKLRIVWKNHPLSFHKNAQPAARAAAAVFALDGNDAFWSAHHALFNRQSTLEDATSQLLERARVAHPDLVPALAQADAKLAEDDALATAIRSTGTPAFFVNGVAVLGMQPFEKFKAVVDDQLQKADALAKKGVAADKVYGELTRAQFGREDTKPPKLDFGTLPDAPTRRLPVLKSPVRGPADALATLVLVTDLACATCRTFAANVADVMASRKDKVRLVVKYSRSSNDAPDSALQVALEARAKKGDAGFWKAFDAIRTEQETDDAALARVAEAAGLPAKAALAAAHDKKHKAIIDADEEALDEAGADWSPSLFVNGREARGYAMSTLAKAVDDEIAAAEKLVAAGTPRAKLYDKLLESAKAPAEPEKKAAPASTKDTPGHGPSNSKVVVQIFGNFESYPTSRLFDLAGAIEADFPGKVRILFRHVPLALQPGAQLAAEAANEAFAQKGDDGFWAMARLLFAGRPRLDGLERPALLRYGAQAGLDAGKLTAALDRHTHAAEVAAELAIAKQAGIRAPTMLVNDVWQVGRGPRLRRLIRKALAAK